MAILNSMKTPKTTTVIKANGDSVKFSSEKIIKSLRRAGANEEIIQEILQKISQELYLGITTKEIYNRAFQLLKGKNRIVASRYKLKKAIYELGPTGFPFERFIGAILENSGYTVEVGKILQGHCVNHEVDVIARNNSEHILAECKFHAQEGRHCNVKVPLYIHSRYRDLQQYREIKNQKPYTSGWVVTNTRFTKDALAYGKCTGLYLLSWNTPTKGSLKERIDQTGLYPITVSTLLTLREKQFLLNRDVVLCSELLNNKFLLDHLSVSEPRKQKILAEMQCLYHHETPLN